MTDKAKHISAEAWRMLTDNARAEMKGLEGTFKEALEEEIKHHFQSCDQLAEAYDDYVNLLGEELNELVGMVLVYSSNQWRSTRAEKGEELRNKIKELKTALTNYEKSNA